MDDSVGKRINCLSTKIKREINNLQSISSIDDISGANSFIIVYIYKNNGKNIYQKDIEREFGITRSTASNIISLMEKKNYVKREAVNDDARLKRLVLTDEAINYCENFLSDLSNMNNDLIKNISDEELEIFLNVINKMENNLKERQKW